MIDFGRRTWRIRRGPVAVHGALRTVVVCLGLLLVTCAVGVAGVVTGDLDFTIAEVWRALRDPDAGFDRVVILEWRVPRVTAAIVFGAALGASGAVFQALTRNPLASPDVIGLSAGSHTGGLVAIILLGGTYSAIAGGALIGGVLTAVAIYLLAYRRGVQGFRLIVVGIGVSAMLTAANTYLILRAELDLAMSAAAWGAGSLNGTNWEQVLIGGGVIVVLLTVLTVFAPALSQLGLGDEAAAASGVTVERTRLTLVVLGVAPVAVVTAAAGPIAFVALAAPQIARRLARTAGVTITPAAFTGAFLLLAADYAAQHLLPVTLPVGLVTVVIGGGYLVWLLVAEARRRL
ncbi:iron ABC transporter permease [Aeromicrobium sp. PE09-221]|nr:iron ABC transporter permease [Aeromicrobium sp. PE09-221]